MSLERCSQLATGWLLPKCAHIQQQCVPYTAHHIPLFDETSSFADGSGKLGTFSIIVGILYMVGMVIEVRLPHIYTERHGNNGYPQAFGIYAAASVRSVDWQLQPSTYSNFHFFKQKLPFVRIYAWGSILSALIVIAVGLIQIVIHFTLKVIRDFDVSRLAAYSFMQNDIINTCANVNNGDTIIFVR